MTRMHDVPTAHTPHGGYGTEMPPPILEGCTEPLVLGAPDLRGTWRLVDARTGEEPLPPDHPIWGHVERIEQAADRVIVTAGGVVHDMVADGSYENGVNDVMAVDFTTRISVAASFENGVLVLRPQGLPDVEVRRWREGDQLVWAYHTAFTARLERTGDRMTGHAGIASMRPFSGARGRPVSQDCFGAFFARLGATRDGSPGILG